MPQNGRFPYVIPISGVTEQIFEPSQHKTSVLLTNVSAPLNYTNRITANCKRQWNHSDFPIGAALPDSLCHYDLIQPTEKWLIRGGKLKFMAESTRLSDRL
jgi:hypothetical protein